MTKFTMLFASLACTFLFTVSLYAQSTASIVGTVRDSTGAVVVGVDITARNQQTGFTRSAVSNSEGLYSITSVPIGPYTLTAALKGFKQSRVPNIVLHVAQQAQLDITLAPGDVTQTVSVSEAPGLVQTETSSMGQVIENKQIVDLPLNGRQFTQLAELTPGAISSNIPNGPAAGSNTGFTTVALGGGQSMKTEYVLDGITDTEQLYNGVQYSPSIDFIQEFKVFSNGFPAQYGNGSGMLVTSTRSGTNQIHGTVFEFIRNDATDARNFFATTSPAPLRRNEFGASFGGPIVKDHLFYFLNYEGTRVDSPETDSSLVPSAAQRSGDLSSLCTGTPAVCPNDPLTGQPFPGNQIPQGRLDGATQFFLDTKFVPLPNVGPNFVYSPAATSNTNQGNIRIDYQLSHKDSVFGRFSINDNNADNPGGIPASGGTTNTINTKNIAIGYTHIFSPNVLNELRLGYAHLRYANSTQGLGTNYTTQAGILGYEDTTKVFPGFPVLSAGSYASVYGSPYSPLINPTTTWEISDIVSWNKGRHSLMFGVDAQRHHITSTNAANSRGVFTFNGQFTGNALADYLLGYPSFAERDYPRNIFGERNFSIPFFAQDDWKVRSNLTLNLGLRYDLALAPIEDLGQNSYFDINTGKFIVSTYKNGQINLATQQVAQATYDAYASSVVTAKEAGLSNNLQTMDKKEFAPRVGFAFRPSNNDKTVLRGAYGIFYTFMPGNPTVSQTIINVPFIQDQTKSAPLGTPTANSTLEQFFNFPFSSVNGAVYISAKDLNIHRPYNQEWNLAVQHAMLNNLALTIAYVGNKGTHLEQNRQMNYPTIGGLPDSPARQQRRPWPEFGLGTNFTNTGNSIYHALQVTLEKRYSSGLYLLSSYAWSKLINDMNIDDSETQQNPADPSLDRALGTQNITNRFTTGFTYALPFGRGMRFGSTIPRALDLAVGGWNFGGIVQMQSGSPINLTMDANPTDTEYANRPNRIGSGAIANPTYHKWFDPTAFQIPAPGTIGDAGRNILLGPGLDNWDIDVLKNFHFTESKYIQFRVEAFNIANHPHFGQPTADIQSPNAGVITSATSSAVGSQRQLEGAIKIYF